MWKNFFSYSDIALIRLPQKVEFSETVKPVKLACSSVIFLPVTVIGNGVMKSTSKKIAPILQFTSLKTITLSECLASYPFLGMRDSVICARGEEQRSTCFGDSGGPLVASGSGALVGVTSFASAEGCDLGFPQGYSNIPVYLEWIKQVTGISECQNEVN